MMPISPTYVRFMTARFGLLKQSQAFFIGIRGISCSTGSSTDAGPGPRVAAGQLDSDPSSEIAPQPRCSSSQRRVQPVFPGPVSPQPVLRLPVSAVLDCLSPGSWTSGHFLWVFAGAGVGGGGHVWRPTRGLHSHPSLEEMFCCVWVRYPELMCGGE